MRICEIDGCNKKHKAKGLCSMHLSRLERHGDINYKSREYHGMFHSPEYKVYRMMLSRCYNPNTDAFKYYGARGIKVCNRWLHSFINFYQDMGERPSSNYQIDRENNNKDYSPDNCSWVTVAVNAQNRRSNVVNWFTVRSIRRLYVMKKYTQVELSKIYALNKYTIFDIVHNKTWAEVV